MENNFDKAAQTWDATPGRQKMIDAVKNAVLSRISVGENTEALDYGTGTGLILQAFQPLVKKITGMDSSTGMLEVLQQKIEANQLENVVVKQHNIEKEPLGENRFDLIITNMTLHHISDTQDFMHKSYAALRNQGFLCITDLETEDGTFHRTPDESIKHLGFDKLEIEKQLRQAAFVNCRVETFNTIEKETDSGEIKRYPLFIAIGQKFQ